MRQTPKMWGLTWTPLSDVIQKTVPQESLNTIFGSADMFQTDYEEQPGYVYVGVWPHVWSNNNVPPYLMVMRADGVGEVRIAKLGDDGEYKDIGRPFRGADEPDKKGLN